MLPPEPCCPGSLHLKSDTAKDVRWFSFWDHAVALDKVYHSESMCHAFALFTEGQNPWALKGKGDASEDSFSARVSAWHVWALLSRSPSQVQTVFETVGICCTSVELDRHISVSLPQVLADDTNQDKMRAFIVVFKALRMFVAECVAWVAMEAIMEVTFRP